VEKTNTERPALGPARVGLEMSKDPASITASVLGKGQNRDDNSNNTGKSPEDSGGLLRGVSATILRFHTQGGEREVQAYINPREVLVAERRDSIAQESQGEEDQEDLVGFSGHDTNAGARLKDIDARDDEEGGSEVHGESDCDVSNEIEPATDPACNAAPSRGGKHESLVVDAYHG
jgi:hypothetical protein